MYRHFPTREALIEAVYRTEVEKLAAAERTFSQAMPPVEALRAWMLLFVDHIATKQIIARVLNAFVGGPTKVYEGSCAQIQGAMTRTCEAGDQERRHTQGSRSLRSSSGADRRLNVSSSPDWQQSARRLVEILITGSRPLSGRGIRHGLIAEYLLPVFFSPSHDVAGSSK